MLKTDASSGDAGDAVRGADNSPHAHQVESRNLTDPATGQEHQPAGLRSQVRSCGIYVNKLELGQVFFDYLGFPWQFSLHQLFHIPYSGCYPTLHSLETDGVVIQPSNQVNSISRFVTSSTAEKTPTKPDPNYGCSKRVRFHEHQTSSGKWRRTRTVL
jgi:hypothetical protein